MLDTVVEAVVVVVVEDFVVVASFHTDTAHLMAVGGMPNFADTTVVEVDIGIEVGKVAAVDMIVGVEVAEDKYVAAAEGPVVQVAAVMMSTERIQICPNWRMDQEVLRKDTMAPKAVREAEEAEGSVTQAKARWGTTAVVDGEDDSTEKVEVVKSVLLGYS